MHKNIINGILVVIVLLFLYFSISPFFQREESGVVTLDNFSTVAKVENSEAISSGFERLSDEDKEEMFKQTKEVNKVQLPRVEDVLLGDIEVNSLEDMIEVVIEETQFPVYGTVGLPAEGFVRVLDTPEGTIVRYEDFSTVNGPRLHVYMSKDLRANDFIDLGPIRGTDGNINYTAPEGVNVSEYRYVLHWSVPFGVLFNYSEINKPSDL